MINQILSNTSGDKNLAVGMGATMYFISDRVACTVVAIRRNRQGVAREIDVQRDDACLTNEGGIYGQQKWEFSPNPKGPIDTFVLRKNGKWVQKGQSMKNGTVCVPGYRDAYYDPSF